MPIASMKMVKEAMRQKEAAERFDDDEAAFQFISGAPDGAFKTPTKVPEELEAAPAPRKVRKLRGRKAVITLNIDPGLLDEFDETCEELGYTRSQMLIMLIKNTVQKTSSMDWDDD